MKRCILLSMLLLVAQCCSSWGFFAHRQINYYAVFLLPPDMLLLYKPHLNWLAEHAVDPDKRRYVYPEEGPRHYIDMDRYGADPWPDLPRRWDQAVERYGEDSLRRHGIVPWHLQVMLRRLTTAFREKDLTRILKNSAELGHYVADSHVPLHACSNHNGQYSNQKGIHGFWESRVPELLADTEFDFFIGKARYIPDPARYCWDRVLESARAADTVLRLERELTRAFPPEGKYAFEERNGLLVRQYSTAFTRAYNRILNGMVERRMRQSVFSVASLWYTAWVNAGQPDLRPLASQPLAPAEQAGWEELNRLWQGKSKMLGREED